MINKIKNTIIKIQTPKGFLLNGLLLGSDKAKTIYIYIHGLGGSLFSQIELTQNFVAEDISVLTFSNRGSGIINNFRQVSLKNPAKYKKHLIGMAHEVFTDCFDDIEGAVKYASKLGAKNIFLIGHSTGCQKSIYYLSHKIKSPVKGAILLAPMSDFADTYALTDRKIYNKAVLYSQNMVKKGKPHELLSSDIWPYLIDAQRFLSLFTRDSVEEIFSYASGKKPTLLLKNKKPLLIVLAEKDEYSDRSMFDIFDWFNHVLKNNKHQINMIENSLHYFSGYHNVLKKTVKDWTIKLS